MPTQLYDNKAIYFIAARNFLYDGVNYEIGQEFPQEAGVGRLDLLVRTRRIVAVVDKAEDKPRHWHHHVWLREDYDRKLGLLKSDDDRLEGESVLNREKQLPTKDASDSTDEGVRDASQEIWDARQRNIEKEQDMDKEREENLDKERVTLKDGEPVTIDGVEQTEPLDRVEPDQGRDISDLHEDVQTGGDYSPHDGDVSDENLTEHKDDDEDANAEASVRDRENSTESRTAAKKTAAKKTAAKKK